jgi:hypothetical protein
MITIQAHTDERITHVWVEGNGTHESIQLPCDHPAVREFEQALGKLITVAAYERKALEGTGANR